MKGFGRYYLLNEKKEAIHCTLWEWAAFLESGKNVVIQTRIGEIGISTVFLGLNHNYNSNGPPLLFETMIFGGEHDQYCDRCSTWDEALVMHENAKKLVEESENKNLRIQ